MLGLIFHSRSHIIKTQEYFSTLNLKVLEISNPETSDWFNNPFNQKNKTWLGTIFLTPFDFSLFDHKIVLVTNKNKDEYLLYWRQVESNLFFGGSIKFKKSLYLNTDTQRNHLSKSIIVSDKCPACGNLIKYIDMKCSECGIIFE